MENETIQAWCYDVRTGWAEIEDVVMAGCPKDTTDDAALSRAGYSTEFLKLGTESFSIEFAVYQNDNRRLPFFVRFVSDDNVEHFYVANVPSLLAWLKDAAQIFQAGLLGDIIAPRFGNSLMDNIQGYLAGLAQAGRMGRR